MIQQKVIGAEQHQILNSHITPQTSPLGASYGVPMASIPLA